MRKNGIAQATLNRFSGKGFWYTAIFQLIVNYSVPFVVRLPMLIPNRPR